MDAQLLLAPEVELSGATCAVVRLEGPRAAVAHLGDCGVLLGKRQDERLRGSFGRVFDGFELFFMVFWRFFDVFEGFS